jgi:hypothetical protein
LFSGFWVGVISPVNDTLKTGAAIAFESGMTRSIVITKLSHLLEQTGLESQGLLSGVEPSSFLNRVLSATVGFWHGIGMT